MNPTHQRGRERSEPEDAFWLFDFAPFFSEVGAVSQQRRSRFRA
jgi:hypothetical protein